MIDINAKIVESCGWAGPLLWVCTTDGYSIHFYDALIDLNGQCVARPADVNATLAGQAIVRMVVTDTEFGVEFEKGDYLRVESSDGESARVFKRDSDERHYIYKSGSFGK